MNALVVSMGAKIRDLNGDTLRFQYVTRASAGAAAAALAGWLDTTWGALLDMVAHRQRLRSFRGPGRHPEVGLGGARAGVATVPMGALVA